MAKEGKAPNAEEVQEKLSKAKEDLVGAKDELKAFLKKNGLKKGEDHSNHEDEKIAKGFRKRQTAIEAAQQKVDKYTNLKKESKKGSGGSKAAKYNYPDGTTAADKKKFRAEVRAKAKRAGVTVDEFLKDPAKYEKAAAAKKSDKKEKAEKPAKKEKGSKKAEAAPAEEAKPKKKKKAEPAPAESED